MATPFSMYQVGAEALLPPRDISVSQWADENVVLTGSGSAERGQWHTRPYQREPMDVLGPSHPCKQVVLMSGAQLLKTSVMVNFLGYIADVDPGPTLAVEPRSEDAKALSKDRVAPLFRHSPALRGKLAAVKSRDSNNTAMHKVFANGSGHITFTGAISPSGLAMRPIRYLLLDEVDRYPVSAGSEGDPVSLAIQRTGEFEHNKKVIMCSTPTVDGESRIQAAWNTSDQREFFVPCPKCNHFQILVFSDGTDGGLVWPEGQPEKAAYCCEHSGFQTSADATTGAIRGRLEFGNRAGALKFLARFDHNSTELTLLKAQTTGAAVIHLQFDANNSLDITWQKVAFATADVGETDQIVTVAVDCTPIYDATNGIITAVAKCNVDAICQ